MKDNFKALLSMTGYADGADNMFISAEKEVLVSVRIKSLNHRFLDLKLKTPRFFPASFEQSLRKKVQEHVGRGSLDVSILVESTGTQGAGQGDALNAEALEKVMRAYVQLKKSKWKDSVEFAKKLNALDVLRMPGLLTLDEKDLGFDQADVDEARFLPPLLALLEKTLVAHGKDRTREGQELKAHISSLTQQIDSEFAAIKKAEPIEREKQIAVISEKARATLDLILANAQGSGTSNSADFEKRLKEELAFWVERRDFEEEIIRFDSHISHFRGLLEGKTDLKDGSIGKTMEFKHQELGREINTLGNKAQSLEISSHVLNIKSLLEKIKEQIANVE